MHQDFFHRIFQTFRNYVMKLITCPWNEIHCHSCDEIQLEYKPLKNKVKFVVFEQKKVFIRHIKVFKPQQKAKKQKMLHHTKVLMAVDWCTQTQ